MDDIDIKIIRLLQENARITASEISSNINLSIPAVSERIKKIESSGIIKQYTAIIDQRLVGKNLTAIMFISLERPKYTEKFIEFIKSEKDILECNYIAGDFDYVLKVVTEGTYTLESLLNRIKSVPGIQKTRTIVVLSTVKNDYSVNVEDNKKN